MTYLYGPPFTSSSPRTAKATSPLSAYQSSTNETTPLHISAGTGGRLIRYDAEEDGPTGEFGFDVCESDDGFAYDGVVRLPLSSPPARASCNSSRLTARALSPPFWLSRRTARRASLAT